MKSKKCILLIDDKDQGDVARSIQVQLRCDFELDFILIRTDAKDYKQDNSENVDREKLKNDIAERIKHKSIDIALTDFDLNSSIVNGLDIVRIVHELRPKVKFLIYSGNWTEVITTVVGNDYQSSSVESLVDGINKLIHANIVNCIGRTDYKSDLIDYLQKNKEYSAEQRLITLLREHGDLTFQSCFPEFKGMMFRDIADMIDSHSDARSNEWIEAVLTQTIAYLVKVNE